MIGCYQFRYAIGLSGRNNNNSDNNQDNVYGVAIRAKPFAMVHPVRLMKVKQRQAVADTWTTPWARESACICTIAILLHTGCSEKMHKV